MKNKYLNKQYRTANKIDVLVGYIKIYTDFVKYQVKKGRLHNRMCSLFHLLTFVFIRLIIKG